MVCRLYEIIRLLYWQGSKLIISPVSANFEILATPPPPKKKETYRPWNTSQARYLPELLCRGSFKTTTYIQYHEYIQWNLLDLACCARHKGCALLTFKLVPSCSIASFLGRELLFFSSCLLINSQGWDTQKLLVKRIIFLSTYTFKIYKIFLSTYTLKVN